MDACPSIFFVYFNRMPNSSKNKHTSFQLHHRKGRALSAIDDFLDFEWLSLLYKNI